MQRMKLWLYLFLFYIGLFSLPQGILAQIVNIPDPNLQTALVNVLEKAPGDPITAADMATLIRLDAEEANITNLTGLAAATNLDRLELRDNAISDLSPLKDLIKLQVLDLDSNNISDLSPLKGLINLTNLNVSHNAITDFSPLAGLIRLESIHFTENPIADLTPLVGLISLRRLHTWGTPIENLSALTALPKLGILDICGGELTDISPLAEMTQLREVYLVGNEITDITPLSSLTGLARLSLRHNQISDVSPLATLHNLTWIELNNNNIQDFSPLNALPKDVNIITFSNPGEVRPAPKITGPWLWVIVPTGDVSGAAAAASGRDYLSRATDGTTTEAMIATQGARRYDPVGNKRWTEGYLSRSGGNNINELVNEIGLGLDNVDHHVAYGSILLNAPREQETTLFVGSSDAVKVWLNGALVHTNAIDRDANDYQDSFSITLLAGDNVLLVAVYEKEGWWSGFFGLPPDTQYEERLPGYQNQTPPRREDVNGDGKVSILDMLEVAFYFGTPLASKDDGSRVSVDVNEDGVVNINDLVLVAQYINAPVENTPDAPISPELVQQWIDMAWTEYDGSIEFQKGITSLENLLMFLKSEKTEMKTALFANYPNPFNPETWIPYQLAVPAEVVLTIRTTTGTIVRTLPLGHQPAGVYKTPNRAAYYDGKNYLGEPVTSGIYFYTLTAGDFTATRKMLIRK
ncbi:hypothetical protein C6499_22555 [Candidatus Poribacteria bacterium]|nr:MAG: hypothetical protein C6499_22555 [Candidatus Poribacteria bacterium]